MLRQRHMVLVHFGVLVLRVDFSVVRYYMLGTGCMEHLQ